MGRAFKASRVSTTFHSPNVLIHKSKRQRKLLEESPKFIETALLLSPISAAGSVRVSSGIFLLPVFFNES